MRKKKKKNRYVAWLMLVPIVIKTGNNVPEAVDWPLAVHCDLLVAVSLAAFGLESTLHSDSVTQSCLGFTFIVFTSITFRKKKFVQSTAIYNLI